jgi:hypothetical protein
MGTFPLQQIGQFDAHATGIRHYGNSPPLHAAATVKSLGDVDQGFAIEDNPDSGLAQRGLGHSPIVGKGRRVAGRRSLPSLAPSRLEHDNGLDSGN